MASPSHERAELPISVTNCAPEESIYHANTPSSPSTQQQQQQQQQPSDDNNLEFHPAAQSGSISAPERASLVAPDECTLAKPSSVALTINAESPSSRTLYTLKSEHSTRTHSPLRESSIPMLSTEKSDIDQNNTRKRSVHGKLKKGTATLAKPPTSKKRKVERKRLPTPSNRGPRTPGMPTGSGKGTPISSSPAPSTRSQSDDQLEPHDAEDEEFEGDEDDDELYCICRRPDTGTFMIGCDGTCDGWFHGKCVGIDERDKNLIDRYACPACTKAGMGVTMWKRMCRRQGCRQPARVLKGRDDKQASKYCCHECGVLHFRNLVCKTRNHEVLSSSRKGRASTNRVLSASGEDVGARGGLISARELSNLILHADDVGMFRRFGQSFNGPSTNPSGQETDNFTLEEMQAMDRIAQQKEEARVRHQLLKDRMNFIMMAKQTATRVASEREVKPKDFCGYDSRVEWTDAQFTSWQRGPIDSQSVDNDTSGGAVNSSSLCDRKKCARHLEWGKLAVDGIRFEMSDNSDRMRGLDKEEQEVRRRAALRANGALENDKGLVEFHAQGLQDRQGNVDIPIQGREPDLELDYAMSSQ